MQEQRVFCGCSQLCVCVEGNAGVPMAVESDGGGYNVGFLRDDDLVPDAEREQLDSTHARPWGESGGQCGKPPCEDPGRGGTGDGDGTGPIRVDWVDCETETVTGPCDDLERIDVLLIRCFDDDTAHVTLQDGTTGCPTGYVRALKDPALPLTLGPRSALGSLDVRPVYGEVIPVVV